MALKDQEHLRNTVLSVELGRKRIELIANEQGLSVVPSATNFVAIDCGQDGAFAKAVLDKWNSIDILVNNAGIMVPPFGKTNEGFEMQMGVNYFAHFLLTHLFFALYFFLKD